MVLGNKLYEVTYRKKGRDKLILKTSIIGFSRKQVLAEIYKRGYVPVTVEKDTWVWGKSRKKIKM